MRKSKFLKSLQSIVIPWLGTNRQDIFELVLLILVSSTNITKARCTPTPDCATIGYTENSCDGKFVRCPFDTSKLFCVPCDNDYKYTCTGNNITGGTGSSCGGKYASCECIDGATFSNGDCICNTSCKVGAIYYSDKTCSSCVDNSKTPIGIVVKDNEIIASSNIQYLSWCTATDYIFLSNDSGVILLVEAQNDYNGYANTQMIVNYYGSNADINTHSGVYCYNYYPLGMENTKTQWYLPALGEAYTYFFNNFNKIKFSLDNLGINFPSPYLSTSTENYSGHAWHINLTNNAIEPYYKSSHTSVICFLKI